MTTGSDIVRAARSFGGITYTLGGHSPTATDCSGFVSQVMQRAGLNVSGWTGSLWTSGGTQIWHGSGWGNLPYDKMQAGDMVLCSNDSPTFSSVNGSHVGIYSGQRGGSEYINECANNGPQYQPFSYHYPAYIGVVRPRGVSGPGSGSSGGSRRKVASKKKAINHNPTQKVTSLGTPDRSGNKFTETWKLPKNATSETNAHRFESEKVEWVLGYSTRTKRASASSKKSKKKASAKSKTKTSKFKSKASKIVKAAKSAKKTAAARKKAAKKSKKTTSKKSSSNKSKSKYIYKAHSKTVRSAKLSANDTNDKYSIDRDKFYPKASKWKGEKKARYHFLNSIRVSVAGDNKSKKGKLVWAHSPKFVCKHPKPPSISVTQMANVSNGEVKFTFKSKNDKTGVHERYDTYYEIYRSSKISGEKTVSKKLLLSGSSRSEEFTKKVDVRDWNILDNDDWIHIYCKAYNRGWKGNSEHKTAEVYLSAPKTCEITRIYVSSKKSTGFIIVYFKMSGTERNPTDSVQLQILKNVEITNADDAGNSDSWSDVSGAVDDGQSDGLQDTVSNALPDYGKHTWYRLKFTHGNLTRFSAPVMAEALDRVDPSLDDEIKSMTVSTTDEPTSLEVKLAWNKDESTGCEISWSESKHGWAGNTPPSTMLVDWTDKTLGDDSAGSDLRTTAYILGLGEGKTYYIRARRYHTDGTTTTHGKYYSEVIQMTPSQNPSGVTLHAPNYADKDNPLEVYWTFEGGTQTGYTLFREDWREATADDTGEFPAWTETASAIITDEVMDGVPEDGETYYLDKTPSADSIPAIKMDYQKPDGTWATVNLVKDTHFIYSPDSTSIQLTDVYSATDPLSITDEIITEALPENGVMRTVYIPSGEPTFKQVFIDTYGWEPKVLVKDADYTYDADTGAYIFKPEYTGAKITSTYETYRANKPYDLKASYTTEISETYPNGSKVTYNGKKYVCVTDTETLPGSSTQLSTGSDALGSVTLDPSVFIGASNLRLRVMVSAGGQAMSSNVVTVAMADEPKLQVNCVDTLTVQPLTVQFISNVTDGDIQLTITANGVTQELPDKTRVQISGETAYSAKIASSGLTWTPNADGTAYTAEYTVPADDDFIDLGSYSVKATQTDNVTALSSIEVTDSFNVRWEHQAEVPRAYVIPHPETRTATIYVNAPENTSIDYSTDVCDIYRVTPSNVYQIATGVTFGSAVTDRWAPYAKAATTRYRVALRTADGDVEFTDVGYSMHSMYMRFDWGEGQFAEYPFNLQFSDSITKDFSSGQHLDGSRPGRWNPGVNRTPELQTDLIRLEEPEQIEKMYALANYSGPIFVRTPQGFAFEADVQVSSVKFQYKSLLVGVTFKATEVTLTNAFKPAQTDIIAEP